MIADQVAERLGNDGMNYTFVGEFLTEIKTLEEVCFEYNAQKERGRIECDENNERTAYYDSNGNVIRYVFPDGSAIVDAGLAWDIEGDELFSWRSE
jgi:hypothetical protein